MPEAGNDALPPTTNDTWRTWLMTGARRAPVDRRRMRGEHRGLKKMLVEGMSNGDDRPHAWKDFSGAMIRHAVDEAIRELAPEDNQVVKLAYFGGYSNRAIAEEVGLTQGAVQRRLRRALATISNHIQHGRALGRRAMYAVLIWLSGRWVHDAAHQLVQASAVAAAGAIIVAQPASAVHLTAPSPEQVRSQATTATPVAPPAQGLHAPAVPAPALPQVQSPVKLPIDVPAAPQVPVKVKPPIP
jgi:RNA polymerase sigma factor (sigma-70 family)